MKSRYANTHERKYTVILYLSGLFDDYYYYCYCCCCCRHCATTLTDCHDFATLCLFFFNWYYLFLASLWAFLCCVRTRDFFDIAHSIKQWTNYFGTCKTIHQVSTHVLISNHLNVTRNMLSKYKIDKSAKSEYISLSVSHPFIPHLFRLHLLLVARWICRSVGWLVG